MAALLEAAAAERAEALQQAAIAHAAEKEALLQAAAEEREAALQQAAADHLINSRLSLD